VTRTTGRLCTLLASSGRSAGVGASIATPEAGDNGRLSASAVTFCGAMVRSCSSWTATSSTGLWRSSWTEASSVSAVAWVSLQWSSWSTMDVRGCEEGRVDWGWAEDEGSPAQQLGRHGGSRGPLTRTESVEETHRRTEGVWPIPVSSFSPLSHVIGVRRAEFGIDFPRLPISPGARSSKSYGKQRTQPKVFRCVLGDRATMAHRRRAQDAETRTACNPTAFPASQIFTHLSFRVVTSLRLFENPTMQWALWIFCFPSRVQSILCKVSRPERSCASVQFPLHAGGV